MSNDFSGFVNTKIYLLQSFDEVDRCNSYLDSIERMLELAYHQVVV